MGVYIAPEIKDRVAVGDDLYTITDSGGKKKLTPSPTEVSEPGTEINKALLQPMADAIERIDADFVPYTLYWWRRRPMSASYYEVQSDGYSYGYSKATFDYVYKYISIFTGEYSSATLQYSKTVTINQSTGAVSLTNPTTVTVTKSGYTNDELQSLLAGKYVKGLYPSTDKIFYIPSASYVVTRNWESASDGSASYYTGYEDSNDPGRSPLTKVMYVSSAKSESIGNWTYVSSDDSETYPHSGMKDGMEYEYFGLIKDAALDALNTPPMNTINFTSANFSGNVFSVGISYDRFAFVIYNPGEAGDGSLAVFGIASKSSLKIFGISTKSRGENNNYNYFSKVNIVARGFLSNVDFNGLGIGVTQAVKVTSTGLTINGQYLGYYSGILSYMKI